MSDYTIKIGLREKKLHLYRGDLETGTYPVAIGKPATPTPVGEFTIQDKIINPGGILGTRWMGFLIVQDGEYGIHGNNNPASIGTAASLGCVRMYNEDVEQIFPLLPVGTRVVIRHTLEEPAVPEKTYKVAPGDSLWKIAQKFSTTVSDLASLNNLTPPYQLQPGQTLKLP